MSDLTKTDKSLVLTGDQKELIKNTVAQGCTDDELKLFFYQCERTKLDPFSRQIHMVKRGNKATIQTGIDGFRAIAERSGAYAGNDEYTFNGGLTEYECSVKKVTRPHSATATIKKVVGGVICEFTASASWDAYCPKGSDFMWKKMPFLMLGKCAEALALRKAFPNDMSGLYTDDEMAQSEKVDVKVKTTAKVDTLKKKIKEKKKPVEVQVEEVPENMTGEQEGEMRELLKSVFVDDDTKSKVESWLTKKPKYQAAEDCLKKLKDMVDNGKKEQEENDEDIPF